MPATFVREADVLDVTATIPVHFHQHGTWGGRGFAAILRWSVRLDMLDDLNIYFPELVVGPDEEEWSGMTFLNREDFPGKYDNYTGDPATRNLLYRGRLQVYRDGQWATLGGSWSVVHDGPISYLHTDLEALTPGQHQLLCEAIHHRGPFSGGVSTRRFLSTEEFERGEKVFYT